MVWPTKASASLLAFPAKHPASATPGDRPDMSVQAKGHQRSTGDEETGSIPAVSAQRHDASPTGRKRLWDKKGMPCSSALHKGVKNFHQCFRRNADPGIGNFDADPFTIPCADSEFPPFIGEFAGVAKQIPEDLLKPDRIGTHLGKSRVERKLQRQIFLCYFFANNFQGMFQQLVYPNFELGTESHSHLQSNQDS